MATKHYRFTESVGAGSRIDRLEVGSKVLERHRPLEGFFAEPVLLTDAQADEARRHVVLVEVDTDADVEQADFAPTEEEYEAAKEKAQSEGRWQEDESPDGEASELERLPRSDLDSRARGLGVENPERLPNKGAVVEAIESVEAGSGSRGNGEGGE